MMMMVCGNSRIMRSRWGGGKREEEERGAWVHIKRVRQGGGDERGEAKMSSRSTTLHLLWKSDN